MTQTPQFEILSADPSANGLWQPLVALGGTLIRSWKEAVAALGVTLVAVLTVLRAHGFVQLAAAWALVELVFCGYQRCRCGTLRPLIASGRVKLPESQNYDFHLHFCRV